MRYNINMQKTCSENMFDKLRAGYINREDGYYVEY